MGSGIDTEVLFLERGGGRDVGTLYASKKEVQNPAK